MSTANRPPSVYIDDVFEEVLALPHSERDAAIEERCAGHPSLAAEVRALLEAEDDQPATPPEATTGSRLGRYTLDSCLGRGASASVWKAWDTHLRTWTALKLIRSDLGHRRDGLQTVLHEARAASAIISDHVVRIKAAGKIPAGPYYVEMQLCAEHRPDREGEESLVIGPTLAEEPPEQPRDAARLAMEAALGAEAAHRVGVFHRDIKPANILLMPISRRALVADFGLSAAHLYPEPGPGTPSTATITIHLHDGRGLLVGTPSFMPPEQAWGEPPTRAADIYALGATLYAFLAKRAPYQRLGERPAPALDVVRMVREGPPRPLSWAAPSTPAQLVRIVEKAMARDPADRYPTAAAMADDLKAFLDTRPTSLDTRRPWLRVGLAMRRNAPVVGLLLTSMLIIEASAVTLYLLDHRRQELTEEVADAETRREQADAAALAAEQVRDEAELNRDEAVQLRDEALEDAKIAKMARDRAKQGQTAAEKRATAEIEARLAAEEARTDAEEARQEAIAAMSRAELLQHSLETELTNARTALQEAERQATWLTEQLDTEMDENKVLESDLSALSQQVLDMRARIAVLEAERELAGSGADAARASLEEAEQTAPWMAEEAPATVGPQPPEGTETTAQSP